MELHVALMASTDTTQVARAAVFFRPVPLRRLGRSGRLHSRRVAHTRERVISVRFLLLTVGNGGAHRVALSGVPGESGGNHAADRKPILRIGFLW